ncbi:DUF4982 domain-containing protein [Gramella sp. AN32]|uniref:DUF4982 domain-containing protein n=1 Tax=Christiangramia antarctica TaxID=2058158 RepID=A0ABW5X917_9FLAO
MSTDRFRLMWKDVTYETGEIQAVAYKDGNKIGKNILKTAGKASKIRLTADRTSIKADGKDLSYILVEAFDKEGNPAPLADEELEIEISGAGHLAGAGNGNPQSFEPFQDNKVNLFYGKAMIIVGSDFEKGRVKISVKPENIQKESITINVE